MFAQRLTVVRGVDYYCVLVHTGIFESVQESADLVVQVGNQAVVCGAGGADLVFGVATEVECLAQPVRRSGKVVEVSRRIVRQVCVFRLVQREIGLWHYEGEVGSHEPDTEGPWGVLSRWVS